MRQEEIRWAARKHQMGYPWPEIAKALGRHETWVYSQVTRSGVPYELPQLKAPAAEIRNSRERLTDWMWVAWLEGYSLQKIANALGSSRRTVETALQSAGYRKVMPQLVVTWIYGWGGEKE